MMSETTRLRATVAACAMLTLLGGCDKALAPDRANFTRALNGYLAKRGHLCLAKYDWPIIVSEAEFRAGGRNAVQMPVLEQLGLVTHDDVTTNLKGDDGKPQQVRAWRFFLTAEAKKYYLRVPVVVQSNAGNRVVHPADLCAATLTLDQLVGWEPPQTYDGKTRTSVTFTYHLDPAPWARKPEAQRAFPMLKRVIDGEGTMQLREGFILTPQGWVAAELLD